MTACRSSRLFAETAQLVALDLRLHALGPLVADDLGDLLGVLLRDALLQRRRRCGTPCRTAAGSPASSAFSEMPRLTSFSLKTSSTALTRSSLLALIATASPDHSIEAPTSLKS